MMMTIMNAEWFDPEKVFDIYDAKIERWRKRLEQFDKTGSMAKIDTASTNLSMEHEKKIEDTISEENALKLIDSLVAINDTLRREIVMSDAIMSIGKE